MTMFNRTRARLSGAALALAVTLIAGPAHAAGSSMPWEAPLQSILESIEGTGREDHRGDHHHRHRAGRSHSATRRAGRAS